MDSDAVVPQPSARLAVGSAQFGLAYGIAGSGVAVPEREVRRILELAAASGASLVDTAPAYGDIEERLRGLCTGLPLGFVSKIPALQVAGGPADPARHALASARLSLQRLGEQLDTLLFHRAEDLLDAEGPSIWQAVADFCTANRIRVGVSCYDPDVLRGVVERYPIAAAQIPGNAFDQRFAHAWRSPPMQVELHLRSAFLQGLLLMPLAAAEARLPDASAELRRWRAWLTAKSLTPLGAALSIVKGHPGLAHCLVGVERVDQLQAIVTAWNDARPLSAPELASARAEVIDPRRWRVST